MNIEIDKRFTILSGHIICFGISWSLLGFVVLFVPLAVSNVLGVEFKITWLDFIATSTTGIEGHSLLEMMSITNDPLFALFWIWNIIMIIGFGFCSLTLLAQEVWLFYKKKYSETFMDFLVRFVISIVPVLILGLQFILLEVVEGSQYFFQSISFLGVTLNFAFPPQTNPFAFTLLFLSALFIIFPLLLRPTFEYIRVIDFN